MIAEGVQRAHILRKVLSNEAMKMFVFSYDTQFETTTQSTGNNASQSEAQKDKSGTTRHLSTNSEKSPTRILSTKQSGYINSSSAYPIDDGEEMLWKLVDEAETNLVAYSEEVGDYFILFLF